MKSINIILRSIALVLGLLAASAYAGYAFAEVNYPDTFQNGVAENVPSGAYYEWAVSGSAHILVGGGGLNVNEDGSSGPQYDVSSTAYADNISYQLNAYGSGGYALFYIGW